MALTAGSPVFQDCSADGMVITDLPKKIPSLDTCAACVAAKSVHFPHKEGRNHAEAYLDQVHIDIARPMPKKLAGGKEYEYVKIGTGIGTIPVGFFN